MALCGNCGDPDASVEQIRACHQAGPASSATRQANRAQNSKDPNRIVTTNCMNPICKVQKTGPLSVVAGFRCEDHGGSWVPGVGDKVMWKGKKWDVLEISAELIRIRTGGKGKQVPLGDLEPVT